MICWALVLVLLVCGFPTGCEGAPASLKSNSNKCQRRESYETHLNPGAGLSCCGENAFNPESATCCKAEDVYNQTDGLSEKVSVCCGLKAYDKLNEICCQLTIIAKPGPKAKCCGKEAYNEDTQLCCSEKKIILERNSTDQLCCGQKLYNKETERCCENNGELVKQPKNLSCPMTDPTPSEQTDCSQPTAVAYPAANAVCCGNKAFNKNTQLCCSGSRIVLEKVSADHLCCGQKQYNKKTERCCENNGEPVKQPKNLSCPMTGALRQSPATQLNCNEPNSRLCGSSCYNPNHFRCCERNQENSVWCCAPGRCEDTPRVYNPHTHICCDGCVSKWKPWLDQCCGEKAYGFAQPRVLCCNNTLFEVKEDGEECSALGVPFNPAKGTMCSSKFHGSPGRHCCGTEKYHPKTEICCDGHRPQKRMENTHCCGGKAYNIQDPLMKCCGGTLHNLTAGHEGQCCGSVLQTLQDVCCSSEDNEVLYRAKTAFRCCGHHYYNSSLWSCCAGKLSPVHSPSTMSKESTLLSVNNVKDMDLCNKMHIGIVESVSSHSVVFSSVLIIHGRNSTVTPLGSPYILKKRDHCTFPKLTPWRSYFFDDVNVFADFNHHSTLQSLHFMLSRCYRP